MKFAVIGGTHGNEPVGVKVLEELQFQGDCLDHLHQYKTFIGNPKAIEIQKRYVDSDLNRAFGPSGQSKGYESERSKELTEQIEGKFDFVLDLHTTTSNMGLTVILTRTDEFSLKAACYLKKMIPELRIIVSMRAGGDCPYTSALAPSALTIEVGPVANNVVNTNLVKASYKMVDLLLKYDFQEEFNYNSTECFHVYGVESYPETKPVHSSQWLIHEHVDGHDFKELSPGDPLFTSICGKEILNFEGDKVICPLFINEAAYQENNTAMECGVRTTLGAALKLS